MKLKKFKKNEDFDEMSNWLIARFSYLPSEAEMPNLGYVVQHQGNKVAMGFLRQCEGGFVQMDSFVTNPDISPELRDKALDLLAESLIKMAYHQGFKQLILFSIDENTLMRSLRHGFSKLPHTSMTLDLSRAQRLVN